VTRRPFSPNSVLVVCLCVAASQSPAAEMTVPDGFAVGVFHDGIGARARHIAVRDNGDVFVARRSGELVALRDTNRDGTADLVERRRLAIGTGLKIHNPFLYYSDNVTVSRLMLSDELMPSSDPEVIVRGFPRQGAHADKAIALNDRGDLFVNVGAPSNACQAKTRSPGSPGFMPCPQLERQAGIWRFSASRADQNQRDGERHVTGTRNVVALDWNDDEEALYFVMHGRDQLGQLWPDLYDDRDSAEKPAEEFHRAIQGANYGWPYTYVDPETGKRMVAPEYGGDGRTEAEPGKYQTPLQSYPAHWAPNDLVFYTGEQFPARYRGGVFIAWHGSWNRAPLPQDGYRVTFQPFADGKVTGPPVDFMTGFAGGKALNRSSDAPHRPTGLAVGPDGDLYVTDTVTGRIWRVRWEG
jgi:glucose/arabinose dehydrogenase